MIPADWKADWIPWEALGFVSGLEVNTVPHRSENGSRKKCEATQLLSWSLESSSMTKKIQWQFAVNSCWEFSWAVFNIAGVDANGKPPSKAELHQLYLSEKYVWKWKQFMSRRGKRTCPLDLKLGHNNWLRQVNVGENASGMHWAELTEIIGSLLHFMRFADGMSSGVWRRL